MNSKRERSSRFCWGRLLALALIISVPYGWVLADDGVGSDGMIGSLPGGRGGGIGMDANLAGGTAGMFPGCGDWSAFPAMNRAALVLRGSQVAVHGSLGYVWGQGRQYEAGSREETGLAIENELDLLLDISRMVQPGDEVRLYAWLPSSFSTGVVTSYLRAVPGMQLADPTMSCGSHYEIDYRRIVTLLGMLGEQSLELGFLDSQGHLVRMRFAMMGSSLRIAMGEL